jgi:diguanylate cyclase (GGDEF)-like protein/PAS domain S-box-containing protein
MTFDVASPPLAGAGHLASEARRLELLDSYGIMGTGSEPAFDDLARLAGQICGTPIAQVNLVGATHLWHKATIGYPGTETPRDQALCDHAVNAEDVLYVPDARADARFADNPNVNMDGGIRLYAGVPLRRADGYTLGTLCVADTRARELRALQLDQLAVLARQVMDQLTLRQKRLELESELLARRQAMEALSSNERLLRGVLDHTDALVYAKDAEGRFTLVNRALERVLGRAPGELLGLTDHEIFPAEVADEYRAHDAEIAATGGRQMFGEQLLHVDGTVHDYLSTKFALRDDDGKAYGLAGVSADVTDLAEQRRAVADSEQRWRQLFTGSPVGVAVTDEEGRIMSANTALCSMLGRAAEDVIGHTSSEFTHPDERPTRAGTDALLDSAVGGVVRIERRYVRPDGSYRWAWLTMARTPGPDGEPWILGHFQDITERKAVEDATARSAADLAAMAAVVRRIQQGDDARQTIVDAGRQLAGATWVTLLEPDTARSALRVTASTKSGLLGAELAADLATSTGTVFLTGEPVFLTSETVFLTDPVDGPEVTRAHLALTGARSVHIAPVRVGATVTAVLTVAWDHQLVDLEDRHRTTIALLADQAAVALRQAALVAGLEDLAVTDELTSLPNRRGWDRIIGRAMAHAARTGRPLTVALADLDHFKRFNDAHGHNAGDALLHSFGTRLRLALRRSDAAARWGGEEFAVALPECSGADAADALSRLRNAVPLGQTCSIGVATWDGSECAATLMRRADRALYDAKDHGRDRISYAD